MALNHRYLTLERVGTNKSLREQTGLHISPFIVLNGILYLALTFFLGGSALGILPSRDGFVVANRIPLPAGQGHPVSEAVWLFALFHGGATLLLTPLIVFVMTIRQKPKPLADTKMWKRCLISLAVLMGLPFGTAASDRCFTTR
jgi:hypothetical protein